MGRKTPDHEDSFGAALDAFIAAPRGPLRVTLVASSPRSPAATAVWARLPRLKACSVTVQAIFAARGTTLEAAAARFDEVFGQGAANRSLSVAAFSKSPSLVEQACFGSAVWSAPLSGATLALELLSDGRNGADAAHGAAEASFRILASMSRPLRAPVRGQPLLRRISALTAMWRGGATGLIATG